MISHRLVSLHCFLQMTNYNYGGGNPMRPHRVRLTTNLVDGYGLTEKMRILRPMPRTREDIMLFHADGKAVYIYFDSLLYSRLVEISTSYQAVLCANANYQLVLIHLLIFILQITLTS